MEEHRPPENREAEAPIKPGESVAAEAPAQPAQRMPARYNLYSRLNVSLRTMDIIIAVLVVLIIAALIVGIFMK